MPKRACPFGESFPNQMKTHVGQKEVAQGVDKEKHMKEIYEKTLAIMFASQRQGNKGEATPGADALTSAVPTSATNGHHPQNGGMLGTGAESCNANGCSSPHMDLLPGQCLLDMHGKIIAGQTVPLKPKESEHPVTPRCCACCKPLVPIVTRCYSCGNPLCSGCARLCLQCENGFCNICSLVNYDEDYDRIFCLSCSSRMK